MNDREALIEKVRQLMMSSTIGITKRHEALRIVEAVEQSLGDGIKLKPMSKAPHDEEILAYHKQGKNYHQVKWHDGDKRWGMRWHPEYRQHDSDYEGWQHLPQPPTESER